MTPKEPGWYWYKGLGYDGNWEVVLVDEWGVLATNCDERLDPDEVEAATWGPKLEPPT